MAGVAAEPVAVLEVRELAFGPAGHALSAPVSFELGAGRCLVLLGPNGAGKTSLLRTLIGSLAALAGSVRWKGRSVGALRGPELAAMVAFCAPRTGEVEDFSVADFVLLGRLGASSLFGQPRSDDLRLADHALERMGLSPLRERRMGELSDGERQLAAIARALAQQAQVLVLDEPASSLDLGRQARLLDLVRSLVSEGQSIILSTHDPNHALAVADEVLLWCEPGRIEWGSASELLEPSRLSQMYGAPLRWYRSGDGSSIVGPDTALPR